MRSIKSDIIIRGNRAIHGGRMIALFCALAALASCEYLARPSQRDDLLETRLPPPRVGEIETPVYETEGQPELTASANSLGEAQLFTGTGKFLSKPSGAKRTAEVGEGAIVLNFENVPLRDVVSDILGRVLGVNYIFDPRVEGTVSLRTTNPLPREAVMPTLEMILRQNRAALVVQDGVHRVVPVDEAVRSQVRPVLGNGVDPIRPGYGVLVVPLRYISAVQMGKILEPLLPPEGILRVDVDRNVIILAGTSTELRSLRDAVDIFDVDWLQGMSAGLFPLSFVSAETVAEELGVIFGDPTEGPLAGLVQFVPLERLNALLVVTQRVELLEKAEEWIERLDKGVETGSGLFVYYVQNGRAADLAQILNQLFEDQYRSRGEAAAAVAPGQQPVTIRSQRAGIGGVASMTSPAPPANAATASGGVREPPGLASEGLTFADGANIRIIADEINNALLILASSRDYKMILAALRKLDIVPLQVLIDAVIADVTLTDDLRYGVQYFLSRGNNQFTLSRGTTGQIGSQFPGFSYSFLTQNSGVVLDALEGVTNVRVLSSPQLMVLDNQVARLQIGDEVPVITQQQQSTVGSTGQDSSPNIINSIQYLETGVILEVTPRVNAGGLVTLDINTEVSNVVSTTTSTIDSPTIQQRKISSSIAVQDGETIILGGLIQENVTESTSGLPFLSRIPLIGGLFGQVDNKVRSTELIVLLTPHVVRNPSEARAITQEIRMRMRNFAPSGGDDGQE